MLINYVFIECLLYAQYCARFWEITKYITGLLLKVLRVQVETGHIHK